MGWTYRIARQYYPSGQVNRKAECDDEFSTFDLKVLKSVLVGSTYYAAIKNVGTGEVFAEVALTTVNDYDFGYKNMDETMGPCKYGCPDSILDLLTPTKNRYANEWRKKCRNRNAAKRMLDKLPLDTTIAVVGNFCHSGREAVLRKTGPSGKGWTDGLYYIPKNTILDLTYRVVPNDYSENRFRTEMMLRKYAKCDKPYRNAYLTIANSMRIRYGISEEWFEHTLKKLV